MKYDSVVKRGSSLLVALLLLIVATAGRAAQTEAAETATFRSNNMAIYHLVKPPNANDSLLRSIEVEFRTSQSNSVYLLDIENNEMEDVDIRIVGRDRLFVNLHMLNPDINGSSLIKKTMDLHAPGITNGEWHRLSVQVESDGQVVLDDTPFPDRLPRNFTARFPYDGTVVVTIGQLFRGCFANASLDGVIRLPLHSKSELLNQTDVLKHIAIQVLPNTGPGCHQAPCQCEPKGVCIYRQWDLLDRCNCTRGYDAASMCKAEWNTCENLESGPPCLNGATCRNIYGVDNFECVCALGFVGSLCQNINLCKPENPCQNGGSCILYGDHEDQKSMYYDCRCAWGFTGKNCTEIRQDPTSPESNLTVIIALSVTFGIFFLMGLVSLGVFLTLKTRRSRMNNSTNDTMMQTRNK